VQPAFFATTLQQTESTLRAQFYVLQSYGHFIEAFGPVPYFAALAQYSTIWEALQTRRDARDGPNQVTSRVLYLPYFTRGTFLLSSLYDPMNNKCVSFGPQRYMFILKRCSRFQQRLVKALLNDILLRGDAGLKFVLPTGIDPQTLFVHRPKLRRMLPKPPPSVVCENSVLLVQPGAYGAHSSFPIDIALEVIRDKEPRAEGSGSKKCRSCGTKTSYSGPDGIGSDITTGSASGSGGDYDIGSASAAAKTPYGRAKAAIAPYSETFTTGSSTDVACYASSDNILGSKMKNLVSRAGLINMCSKESVQQHAFPSHYEIARVPLVLAWEASSKYDNCTARRDICVAKNVVRNCSDNYCGLLAYGKYIKEPHPTRDNLFADEFALLHTPVPAKTKFTLGNFVTCRVAVTTFSA